MQILLMYQRLKIKSILFSLFLSDVIAFFVHGSLERWCQRRDVFYKYIDQLFLYQIFMAIICSRANTNFIKEYYEWALLQF